MDKFRNYFPLISELFKINKNTTCFIYLLFQSFFQLSSPVKCRGKINSTFIRRSMTKGKDFPRSTRYILVANAFQDSSRTRGKCKVTLGRIQDQRFP